MTKKLYMAVTTDKYELPIYVTDSLRELSVLVNRSVINISSCITRDSPTAGRLTGYRFKKVEVEVYDNEKHLFEKWEEQ